MIAPRPFAAWNTVRTSRSVRSAGTLVGGTAAAQAVIVVALPLLTRLYDPSDFTVLAVYSALLFMLTYAATGRFEVAIPLVTDDEEAANLLVLALLCSLVTSAVVGLVLVAVGGSLADAASVGGTADYLWLLPISVALAGSFLAIQNWWLRRRAYGSIATTRFSQAVVGVGVQLGMGVAGWKPIGLLVGHLIMSGAGSLKLMRRFWREERHFLKRVNLRSLRSTAYANRKYPQYSIVDALAANAGEHLPLIIIAALSGGPEAGLLFLTIRVVGAPVQLLAKAVGQVYHSTVAQAHREGRLQRSTAKLVRTAAIYGSGPLLFGSFAAAPLFGLVFGENWAAAGTMLLWVAPWYALRLPTSALLSLPPLLHAQRQIMIIRLGTLVMRVAAIYIGFYLWDGRSVEALAIASVAHWLVLLLVILRLARVRTRDLGVTSIVAPLLAALGGMLAGQLISLAVAP